MNQPSKRQYSEVKINGKISDKVKDYSNDPYFIKKDQEADAFLRKNGFPEELLKIRQSQL